MDEDDFDENLLFIGAPKVLYFVAVVYIRAGAVHEFKASVSLALHQFYRR